MRSTPRSRAPRAIALATVVAFTVATWFAALDAGFLVDDYSIARAAADGMPRVAADFGGNWLGFRGLPYYRPLVTASFALDHAVLGGGPVGYHLSNVLLHAIAACLVAVLVRRLTRAPWFLATAAACAFAAHPTHANGVAWIAARADVLGGVWILAAGVAAAGRSRWLALFVALALLTKETGVLALPIAGVVAFTARGGSFAKTVRYLVPSAIVAAAWLVLHLSVVDAVTSLYGTDWEPSLTSIVSGLENCTAAVLRAMLTTPPDAAWVGTAAIVVAGAVTLGAVLCPAARRGLAVGALCVIGVTLPVIPLAALIERTDALACGRFWYLASAGAPLAVAAAIARPRVVAMLGAIALFGAAGWLAVRSQVEIRAQVSGPASIATTVAHRIATWDANHADDVPPLFIVVRPDGDRFGDVRLDALAVPAASSRVVLALGPRETGEVVAHHDRRRSVAIFAEPTPGEMPTVAHTILRDPRTDSPRRLSLDVETLDAERGPPPLAALPPSARVRVATPLGLYPPLHEAPLRSTSALTDELRLILLVTQSLCHGHAILLVTDPNATPARSLVHLHVTRG